MQQKEFQMLCNLIFNNANNMVKELVEHDENISSAMAIETWNDILQQRAKLSAKATEVLLPLAKAVEA